MIIKADNRGRISLAQLGAGFSKRNEHIGVPHSEWDVTVSNGQVNLRYAGPDSVEEKLEWVKIYAENLEPEMIGQIIGIYAPTSLEVRAVTSTYGSKDGLWGRLVAYNSIAGTGVELRIEGIEDVLTSNFQEGKPRVQHIFVRSNMVN